jgi:hypothetical protein
MIERVMAKPFKPLQILVVFLQSRNNLGFLGPRPAKCFQSAASPRAGGSAIDLDSASLAQVYQQCPSFVNFGELLPRKGPFVRHVHGAQAERWGNLLRSSLDPFLRSSGRRLLVPLDSNPGDGEDQGHSNGDQRFRPGKPHHQDHSFCKSGERLSRVRCLLLSNLASTSAVTLSTRRKS